MHEFAIAQSLIEAAEAQAASYPGSRVRKLYLRVGLFRQIDDLLLQEAFSIARAGTALADAELCIEKVGINVECKSCRTVNTVSQWLFQCPKCGGGDVVISGGDELDLMTMDLEVPDEGASVA